ncbi:unnamed protein product, partial [Pelagomonas calceolata]
PAKSSEFWLRAIKGCPTAPISTPTPSAAPPPGATSHQSHRSTPPTRQRDTSMWKLLLLTAAATAVELKQKMIIRNTGSEDLAVYFMGALHEGDLSLWDGSETLNDIVSPGQVTARYVRYNDSFAVRSGDLKWRVRLSLYKNDDAEQPYKMTFHNVMTDEKDQPVELKHHAAGYLWIEPNHHVTHSAAQGHEFALRDRESKERLAVSVHALGRDEL